MADTPLADNELMMPDSDATSTLLTLLVRQSDERNTWYIHLSTFIHATCYITILDRTIILSQNALNSAEYSKF